MTGLRRLTNNGYACHSYTLWLFMVPSRQASLCIYFFGGGVRFCMNAIILFSRSSEGETMHRNAKRYHMGRISIHISQYINVQMYCSIMMYGD